MAISSALEESPSIPTYETYTDDIGFYDRNIAAIGFKLILFMSIVLEIYFSLHLSTH